MQTLSLKCIENICFCTKIKRTDTRESKRALHIFPLALNKTHPNPSGRTISHNIHIRYIYQEYFSQFVTQMLRFIQDKTII